MRLFRRRSGPAKHALISQGDAHAILLALGWNKKVPFVNAVRSFQRGWALGDQLKVDGVVGPKTMDALLRSKAKLDAGQGTASANFSFAEFKCQCLGRYADCESIWVLRELIQSLEILRLAYYKTGMVVRSGCRCNHHNADVGGKRLSQHLYGAAADIDYKVLATDVAHLGMFSGIGKSAKTALTRHVDRRDASGINPTKSSLAHPEVWDYAE